MKSFILGLVFLSFFYSSYSQQLLFEGDYDLNVGQRAIEPVYNYYNYMSYPTIDYFTNELKLFLFAKKGISIFSFNESYELQENSTIKILEESEYPLGHSLKGDQCLLFFNVSLNKYSFKSINFKSKAVSTKPIELVPKGEKYFTSISYQNKFYVLTITSKGPSILHLYIYDGSEIPEKKSFDMSRYRFSTPGESSFLNEFKDGTRTLALTLVNELYPNPLELSAEENKIYYYDNKFVITIDGVKNKTFLVSIDLNSFKLKVDYYYQPQDNFDKALEEDIYSSSFLFQDILCQVSVTGEELNYSVRSLSSDTLINIISIDKYEKEEHLNGSFAQIGSFFSNSQDTFEKEPNIKQFLRKVSNSSIGITAKEENGKYKITVGTSSLFKIVYSGGNRMSNNNTNLSTSTYNTTNGYRYYSSNMFSFSKNFLFKSLSFNSLLDKENLSLLENQEFKIKDAYLKIIDYLRSDEEKYIFQHSVFKVDDYYVLCYFHTKDKKFRLLKFED